MRVGETDPELRRIIVLVFLDDGVTPATDADTLPGSAYSVSINGAAPVAAGGSFVGDGTGEYYYQASAAEVASAGFLAFRLKHAGYTTVWESDDVGDLFGVGETDPLKLRLPMLIRDDQEPPALALATVTAPSQLQTSLNDVSFTDAPGSLHQVADGLHYYQAVASEAVAEGLLVVKFEKTGFQREVAFARVTSFAAAPVPGATLISITPQVDTPPGDPGGFPAALDAASAAPVVAVIGNGVPNLDRIFVTAAVDGVEEVVYYNGLFRGRYLPSSQSVLGDQLTLVVRRTGGWSQTAGEMLFTIEGVTPATFHLLLPSAAVEVALAASPAVAGAIDHAEDAVSRLPAQFRKPRIEALLRALCSAIQTFENAAVSVLNGLDINVAVGVLLRSLAKRVGQSPVGFTDDETLRRFVRARVAANRSSGTTEDLIRVTRLVIDEPNTTVYVETRTVATTVVTLFPLTTPVEVAAVLIQFLNRARSSATRIKLVYFPEAPLFQFNVGPGFGVGHLATSLE